MQERNIISLFVEINGTIDLAFPKKQMTNSPFYAIVCI